MSGRYRAEKCPEIKLWKLGPNLYQDETSKIKIDPCTYSVSRYDYQPHYFDMDEHNDQHNDDV